ncbi:hypothetical protein JX266_014053 [Neoarthrinium moseri]|nr:hypothetical protein JX266_014053 [Neoarthrinium moseri]
MIKSFGVDDWLMLIAMFFFTLHTGFCLGGVAHGTGQHAVDLTASDITMALQNWWFCYLWYCATMIFSKASIAFFLLRLTPIRSQRITIYVTLGVSTLISVAFFFVAMLQCLPVSFFWTRLAGTGSYFTFTFLPLWLVKGLQVDKRTKFALVPILSLGATASCAVAVRLAYVQSFRDSDFLWATTDIAIWSQVEQGLAITAGSLSTLKPLFRRALIKLHITNLCSQGGETPSTTRTKKHNEREAWVRGRETTHEEDMAYSLLGIFDVHMPLIYGEGREKAQRRLREEARNAVVGKRTNDFSIPFSLSEVFEVQHFVARERERVEMRRNLSSDGSRRIVVLHGLGGIGKTQLAVAYTTRYRDQYSAIFWLSIKDEASIRHSFTKAAMQILRQHPDTSGLNALDLQQNHDEVIEAVKTWLSLPGNTKWLVVYDNYDNPQVPNGVDGTGIDIRRFLPMSYQGSIIITTRLSQVDIGHRIRISKITSVEDSLEILSMTSGRDDLDIDLDARDLVEELDGLPLALATAGAYLRHVPVSISDYLRLYKGSWARLHANTPSLGSYQDRTLTSTWQVSYERIKSHNPLAANLLQLWAYFDNEDVWFELLLYGDNGPAWINKLHDELNFNSAMGILHDYGFVEPHSLSPDLIQSRSYSIHACLHSWTIHVLNQVWDGELNKLAVECIASRAPSHNDDQFWLIQRRLLPHAMISCTTIPDSVEGIDWAFHNLGLLYSDQGKMQEAEEMYLRALRGYEKAFRPQYLSKYRPAINTICGLQRIGSDRE